MILSIYVENYIIIEKVTLDFNSGFSCFTGETGAGKSLIIDALDILLGNRFSSDLIRKGKDFSRIEATIEINSEEIKDKLLDSGFTKEDVYVFSREVNKDNKGINRINGRSCTMTFMKEILNPIIDIHSQHDNQYLLSKKYHLNLLDRYIDSPLLEEVNNRYKEYNNLKIYLNELKEQKYSKSELDFLKFQVNEIEELNLHEEEINELESRFKLISAFEKSASKIDNAINIYENNNLKEQLWQIVREIESFTDEEMISIVSVFKDGYFAIDDSFANLKKFRKSIDFSDLEVNQIQSRLYEIKKVQRKFGDTYPEIIEKKNMMLQSIHEIENSQELLEKLENDLLNAERAFLDIASEYSELRKTKSLDLENDVLKHLKDLDLPNSTFKVSFNLKEGKVDGIDDIEFLLSTNVNIDPRPMIKVASGGELSRIMLGLKIIFSKLQGIETIVFDEIDTGVSGTTAFSIGKKMQELGSDIQVISITHLAQVVGCSDYHYYVNKLIDNGETITTVKQLSYEETIQQLAVLGVGMINENSVNAATLLYQQGRRNG